MNIFETLLFLLNEMSPYVLLGFLIAGVMHSFVSRPMMSKHLAGGDWRSVLKAALFGVPLPLCSCGVLPTAVSMRRSGASKGATTSFLIATPQTGVDSIAATASMLGPAFAVVRPVAALVTAVAGGTVMGKMENETSGGGVSEASEKRFAVDECAPDRSFGRKCLDALRYGFVTLLGSIGGWLMAGLVIAALITRYVPADALAFLGATPVVAMLAVLVIAIPMYVCATGSIPIAMSLVLKGLSPGTAFVLLMAGPAVNFASFTLISREMGRRAAWVYLAAIVGGALAFGLIIDYLLPRSWFELGQPAAAAAAHCHHLNWFETACSGVLVALLAGSFIKHRSLHHHHHHHHNNLSDMTQEYKIRGMNCPHCQASVASAISGVEGVTEVDVNLSSGIASVRGAHDAEKVRQAVKAAGFDVV